jgi:hypothetical protein
MKIINSWTSRVKQPDKFEITVRISILTVFELNVDLSRKFYKLVLFNLGINS